MEVKLKLCKGNCSVCKGYGGQCWLVYKTIKSFVWWGIIMGTFWNIKFRYWDICTFFRYTVRQKKNWSVISSKGDMTHGLSRNEAVGVMQKYK